MQIQFKQLKGGEPGEEDTNRRTSLQHALAHLVSRYEELKDEHFDKYGEEYQSLTQEEFNEKQHEGTLLEIHEYDSVFKKMRKESEYIAIFVVVAIISCTTVVVIGWVYFDFFSPDFMSPHPDISEFQRYWFGIVSGIAFLVIVIPWLCAILSIFGVVNTLVIALSARVTLFKGQVERCHHESMVALDQEITQAERAMQLFESDPAYQPDRTPLKFHNYFSYPNMEKYPKITHEAFLLRRQILLACHEFDWILGLLLVVCSALIVLPILTILEDQQKEMEGTHVHWHYYFRDAFNLIFGCVAMCFALAVTSRLTSECNHFMAAVTDLSHCCDPNLNGMTHWMSPLTAHEDLVKYMSNPLYQVPFHPECANFLIPHKSILVGFVWSWIATTSRP